MRISPQREEEQLFPALSELGQSYMGRRGIFSSSDGYQYAFSRQTYLPCACRQGTCASMNDVNLVVHIRKLITVRGGHAGSVGDLERSHSGVTGYALGRGFVEACGVVIIAFAIGSGKQVMRRVALIMIS
jgi:hypothetical protein